MWEVTAAVVATALSITVLPFATALVTNWLDARRAERRRRREIFEDLVIINTKGMNSETVPRANELRAMLRAQMSPKDNAVREATWKAQTYAATPAENDVLRAWVFGHARLARKLAKQVNADPANRPLEQ